MTTEILSPLLYHVKFPSGWSGAQKLQNNRSGEWLKCSKFGVKP
jgi:hypothetical protein